MLLSSLLWELPFCTVMPVTLRTRETLLLLLASMSLQILILMTVPVLSAIRLIAVLVLFEAYSGLLHRFGGSVRESYVSIAGDDSRYTLGQKEI
jgi:hypothetical protein